MSDSDAPVGPKEKLYDDEIAPVLYELGKKCQAAGVSFLALVEWDSDAHGTTGYIAPDASVTVRLADAAIRSKGNFDRLAFSMHEYAKNHGHNSMVLTMMDREP